MPVQATVSTKNNGTTISCLLRFARSSSFPGNGNPSNTIIASMFFLFKSFINSSHILRTLGKIANFQLHKKTRLKTHSFSLVITTRLPSIVAELFIANSYCFVYPTRCIHCGNKTLE